MRRQQHAQGILFRNDNNEETTTKRAIAMNLLWGGKSRFRRLTFSLCRPLLPLT
jgi:hypothetical protein